MWPLLKRKWVEWKGAARSVSDQRYAKKEVLGPCDMTLKRLKINPKSRNISVVFMLKVSPIIELNTCIGGL